MTAAVDNRHMRADLAYVERGQPELVLNGVALRHLLREQFVTGVVRARADVLHQRRRFRRRQEDVHKREARAQRCGVFDADHAAHQRKYFLRVAQLQRADGCQVPDRCILRLLAYHARVQHDDVGRLLVGAACEPKSFQFHRDALRVRGIHLTAPRRDVVFHGLAHSAHYTAKTPSCETGGVLFQWGSGEALHPPASLHPKLGVTAYL